MNKYFSNLKSDFPASIIVFLVAVPLCLGIALASGAPLFSGIIAGIIGGIVVGSFSGSQLGVSGPAAGLAAIVLVAINELGFNVFLVAVVLAGIIQIIFGFLRAGIIGYYFPNAVIKGMLAGIGLIIFMKQIPVALGALGLPKDFSLFSDFSMMIPKITTGPMVITGISLLILILWEQKFMKKIQLFKFIQGPLVVVALGVILGIVFNGVEGLQLRKLSDLNDFVNIPNWREAGINALFTFPEFSQITNKAVWVAAGTIALVASLETLLCLEATDKLDPMKRVSPANQELIAQGIGNTVSGLIGGLPITQVIVRSSTNILSGGKTKMSAIIHGVILVISAFALPTVLNMIPLASLAAILFLVGYKLAKPSLFVDMFKKGWRTFLPFLLTVLGIVWHGDLLEGIGLGLILAILFVLYDNYKKPFLFETNKHLKDNGEITMQLSEDVTFLNKANIQRALKAIPDGRKVIIDASKTIDIHEDVIEIIEEFEINAKERNIEVVVIERELKEIGIPVKAFESSLEKEVVNS